MKTRNLFLLSGFIILFLCSNNLYARAPVPGKTAAEIYTYDTFKKMLIDYPEDFLLRQDHPHAIARKKPKLPPAWSWLELGIMTPVKNQGTCSSCWAFASVGVTEALIARATKNKVDLSEQQLISCSRAGNCVGGSTVEALLYIRDQGLVPEVKYPYLVSNSACSLTQPSEYYLSNIWNENLHRLSPADKVSTLKEIILTYGPVCMILAIYEDFYYSYDGGVYKYDGNSPLIGFHTVVCTGWADDPSITNGGYWICKNSWGTDWAEKGYFRIAYGQAMIDDTVSYAEYLYTNNNNSPVFDNYYKNITAYTDSLLELSFHATDPNGGTVRYSSSGMKAGMLFDAVSGDFSWIPSPEQAGKHRVQFFASAGNEKSIMPVTFLVSVRENTPPQFINNYREVQGYEGVSLVLSLQAFDRENDIVTYMVKNLPEYASFNKETGGFKWIPGYEQAGNYSIEFTASDGKESSSQRVVLLINDVNRPPVFKNTDYYQAREGEQINIEILAIDPDTDDKLDYEVSSLPDGATFKDNFITWTPTYTQAGVYEVILTVNDGHVSVSKKILIEIINYKKI